jgi:hypothetical protein
MKVYVKRLVTMEFLTNTGTWTSDPAKARDFKTSTDALTFCADHELRDSEPVMELAQSQFGPLPYAMSHGYQEQALSDY